jgi:hypothetical protein
LQGKPITEYRELVTFINELNEQWVDDDSRRGPAGAAIFPDDCGDCVAASAMRAKT